MKQFIIWWILALGLGFTPLALSSPLQDQAEQIAQDYENGKISSEIAEQKLAQIRKKIEDSTQYTFPIKGPPLLGNFDPGGYKVPPGGYWLARNSGFLSGLVTFVLWAVGIGIVGWFILGIYLSSRSSSSPPHIPPPERVFGDTSAVRRTPSYTPPPVMRPSPPPIQPLRNLSGQYARQGNTTGRHSGEVSPDLV